MARLVARCPKLIMVSLRKDNGELTPLLNVRSADAPTLACAPIAQRTRAPVFGTGGRGFKSL